MHIQDINLPQVQHWPDHLLRIGIGVNWQAVKRTNTAHTPQNISWHFQKCPQWHYKCTPKRVMFLKDV